MAAPVTTTRVEPVGAYLEEGFPIVYAFSVDPDISIWEKNVVPPGIDNGEKINVTTQHTDIWRQFASRFLKELTDGSFTCAYDPSCYSQVLAACGVEGSVTCVFPNGDTYSFHGYLKSFKPTGQSEGNFPEATVEIVCTNRDPLNKVESTPVYVAASGT